MLAGIIFLINLIIWSMAEVLLWPEYASRADKGLQEKWQELKHKTPLFRRAVLIGKIFRIVKFIPSTILFFLDWRLFILALFLLYFPLTRKVLINFTALLMAKLV